MHLLISISSFPILVFLIFLLKAYPWIASSSLQPQAICIHSLGAIAGKPVYLWPAVQGHEPYACAEGLV